MLSLTDLIQQRGSLIGSFATLGLDAYELACLSGVDLVVADGEHGAFDLESLRRLPAIANAAGVLPIARLPAGGRWMIETLLDSGFSALIAPMVNSADQAREFVSCCYYPPLGLRSQSTCRASLREGETYRRDFNQRFSCMVMIEHMDAVREIDQIVAVPGISGFFIGPTDLESSLVHKDPSALAEAIARVRLAVRNAGKWVGIAAPTVERAVQLRNEGFDFVIVSTDRKILRDASCRMVSSWRQEALRG